MELNKTEFAGDILINGADGMGNIVIEDGLVKDCRNFSTAVYLSLFGGNARDDAGRDNETWWGNLIPGTKKNEKLVSSFYAIVSGFPINSNNIKRAARAAKDDLSWMIEEGIADEIDASIHAISIRQVQLTIRVSKSGNDILKDTYGFQWQSALQ
ncbi:MAG: hypothetical protein MR771_07495 [Treponema succinifaciens]|uniref:hypothetical protein n=1 Tax=Treponema succinifaciens TaxID=167 RepID=UPI00235595E7|nr:hypothetical protein [Treponema succinifaciens]MCI6912992.1 hypothetical protein [Treponema succinifaciens]